MGRGGIFWRLPDLPRRRQNLAEGMADGINVHGVDRRAAAHKKAITLDPAKAQIRHHFRCMEKGKHSAIRMMNAHAVGIRATPTRAAPNIALRIATHTVGETRSEVGEHFGMTERRALHIKHNDVSGMGGSVRYARVRNIKLRKIW